MLKVMIVDDEYLVRERLKKCLPWQEYGFDIVQEASNGEDALELLKEHRSDLVIADIKMPFIDGIEFARRAREHDPNVKVIILTGYSDFEFARTAIQAGVVNYLLKPVNRGELQDVLLAAKATIESEAAVRHTVQLLRFESVTRQGAVKEQFFRALCNESHQPYSERELAEQLSDLMPELSKHGLVVLVANIHGLFKRYERESEQKLIRYAAKNISDELLNRCGIVSETGYDAYGKFVALCSAEIADVLLFVEEFRRQVNGFLKHDISVGVSSRGFGTDHLYALYLQASSALKQRFLHEGGKTYSYAELQHEMEPRVVRGNMRASLAMNLQAGNDVGWRKTVEDAFDDLRTKASLPLLLITISEWVLAVKDFMLAHQIDMTEIMLETHRWHERLEQQDSLDELKRCAIGMFDQLAKSVHRNSRSSWESVVQSAKLHIDAAYANPDLSLISVASHVFVHPTHLSHIFKKVTGVSFSQYLLDQRLQQAREMIGQGYCNLGFISVKTGFNDPYYFSKCFKKQFGITPTQYMASKNLPNE